MNILYLHDNTLYFYGFSKLRNMVSILYSGEKSPAVIAPGENRSSVISFEISNHSCQASDIIEYFQKKGAIGYAFVETNGCYIQSPIYCPHIPPQGKEGV